MANVGTELKMNVHIDPIDGIHMCDLDFKVDFYVYQNLRITIPKDDLIRKDDDNYIALVDTAKVGSGVLKAEIVVQVPDSDFEDNYRKEVIIVDTGETIV